MKTRFFKVLECERGRGIEVGDIICTTSGSFMIKIATCTKPTRHTSVFCSEPDWPKQSHKYKEISERRDLIGFVTELRKLIPHMPSGKVKQYWDLKSEMKNRMAGY